MKALDKILQLFVPKEKKFFPMFKEQADIMTKAADLLMDFIRETNIEKRKEIYGYLKHQERLGDDITHRILRELNSSFLTPFDREDIQMLVSKLDDVIDYINGAANRAVLYKFDESPYFFIKISEHVRESVLCLREAMYELENIKKKPEFFEEINIKVNDIENAADDVFSAFLLDLFENEKDAIELIKKKEIMQSLEDATDKSEDVTDALMAILVKLA